ncbi:MAG: transposase, partial [Desulfobacterales bacterium]
HARERAMERRTAMKNQLQDLVFVIFPELGDIIKPSTKTGMYLIKHYSDPESIVSIDIDTLCNIVRKISRGKLGIDRAKKLYNAAKESIGITEGKESILLETSHLVSNIETENRYINGLEEQLVVYLNQIPYSHTILSIKGIGNITVGGLIGEVGDFWKFKTISEVMKLAGLDLFEVSSGRHKGKHRISKRGRALMRKLLFFAAINSVKSHGIMHTQYQKMLNNGTPKIKALIAISRKLLRIIFALARDNAKYVENYKSHEFKLAA